MTKPKNTAEKRTAKASKPVEQDKADHQPAYFLSLSLENVRCFGPEQTLDLSDGKGKPARWTVILGINGTGKTTLLQSLVGFASSTEFLDFRTGLAPRFFDYSCGDQQNFVRSERQGRPSWSVKVAASHTLTASPAQIQEYLFQMHTEGGGGALCQSGPGEALPAPWCCAYGAGRRMGVGSLSEAGSDDPTASLFSDKADLRNAEEWLLRLDYAAAKESDVQAQQRERLKQVKHLLLSVLPEEIEDIRFISGGSSHPTPRAEFKTPYGWVPLRQLGYGYQTLITWVTDLANRMVERYPDSPDPLAEAAVVLVDEIDLHLHPVWQRKLMGFLTERFPNTQFIATSHSPLVAQTAADANLAVLRREGDHVVIDNDVDNIRNWRIDQILTSDLFGLESARPPQIEPLLAERKRILTKPQLTDLDKQRLEEIEAKIGPLPLGETAQEIKEMQLIRETLDLLMRERQSSR